MEWNRMKPKIVQKADSENEEGTSQTQTDARRKLKRRVTHTLIRISCWAILVVLILTITLTGGFFLLVRKGERSLRDKTVAGSVPKLQLSDTSSKTDLPETEALEETDPETNEDSKSLLLWEPDWVEYNDKIYDFNQNIRTFLVMGIDKNSEVTETSGADGGQSDSLFLVVVNQEKEQFDLIAVNRDTMTDIYLYGYEDTEGNVPVVTAQITTQHGFGDGKELSCQYTSQAVSAVFFNIPINGYISLDISGVSRLNDAVGGVTVTIPEDMTKIVPEWTPGTEVHLLGWESYLFLRWRDITIFESNRTRLERQKQYLKEFVAKALDMVKKDITFPAALYKELTKYIVTDLSIDEVTYMASSWLNYKFGSIYSMEGTTLMGSLHEEFYPDYEALRELVLNLFYNEIELP